MRFGYNWGYFNSARTLPLSALQPTNYISSLLERQALPVFIRRDLRLLLLGNSTTDLVAGATFTPANGALVNQALDETTRVNQQSNLAAARFTFPATNSRLDADSVATLEIGTQSALLVWVVRYPTTPVTTQFTASKRLASGDNNGYEIGIQAATGVLLATADSGVPAPVTTTLTDDETMNQVGGTWRVHAFYRDAANNIIQLGTDRELGPQASFTGDLTTSQAFSLGAGRVQGVAGQEVLFVAGWIGPSLNNLFGAGASQEPVDGRPNLTDNVCIPIFLDCVGANTVQPL